MEVIAVDTPRDAYTADINGCESWSVARSQRERDSYMHSEAPGGRDSLVGPGSERCSSREAEDPEMCHTASSAEVMGHSASSAGDAMAAFRIRSPTTKLCEKIKEQEEEVERERTEEDADEVDKSKKKIPATNIFADYISGDSHEVDKRSHLLHTWRRAPLVNHNYDSRVGGSFILSPDSKIMLIWGFVMISTVMWAVVVAPLEIAIVHSHIVSRFKWVECADWAATLLCIMDIPINFVVGFEQRSTSGVKMVFNRDAIVSRYLRGFFLWDVICALPLDSLHRLDGPHRSHSMLRVIGLIRLVRVVKLRRIQLLSRVDLRYTSVTIMTVGCLSLVAAHWTACVWSALTHMQTEASGTWLDMLNHDKIQLHKAMIAGNQADLLSPEDIYMWSLYFAISLITTVGFGDIAPQTDTECAVCTFAIIMGSVLWAFVLSSLLDVLNRINPHRAAFEGTMDELNRMMHDHSIPATLRKDVRHYFFECQDLWKLQRRSSLIDRMSRSLKGRVTLALNGEWIEKVVYIRALFVQGIPGSTTFVVDISRKMLPKIFSPGERLATPVLYIIRKGLIAAGGRLLGVGHACGEDLLLHNPANRAHHALVALTMSGTLALSRSSFMATLEKFPLQRKAIRTFMVWLAVRRGFARELRAIAEKAQAGKRKRVSGCFFTSMSSPDAQQEVTAGRQTQSTVDDLDMQQKEVATVKDLNAFSRRVEILMEKQQAGVQEMLDLIETRRSKRQDKRLQRQTSPVISKKSTGSRVSFSDQEA